MNRAKIAIIVFGNSGMNLDLFMKLYRRRKPPMTINFPTFAKKLLNCNSLQIKRYGI
jgi:hypothetical protein